MEWNSSFNAQGSRLIIIHVYVGVGKNILAQKFNKKSMAKSNKRSMAKVIIGETKKEGQNKRQKVFSWKNQKKGES